MNVNFTRCHCFSEFSVGYQTRYFGFSSVTITCRRSSATIVLWFEMFFFVPTVELVGSGKNAGWMMIANQCCHGNNRWWMSVEEESVCLRMMSVPRFKKLYLSELADVRPWCSTPGDGFRRRVYFLFQYAHGANVTNPTPMVHGNK